MFVVGEVCCVHCAHAIAELERCHKVGAIGVGELGDKGLGEFYSKPTTGWGLHIDDPRMKPLLEKCAELHMPVSIHVAEDAWMYLNDDSTNDGLMNAATWKVDMTKKGILNHDELIATLEHAVRDNPKTTFIACHFANTCSDLSVLARLFDTYPNLYADIAARYAEIAPIPRYAHDFMEKYADRLLYGTDMGTSEKMYRITFRILETADEHFYEHVDPYVEPGIVDRHHLHHRENAALAGAVSGLVGRHVPHRVLEHDHPHPRPRAELGPALGEVGEEARPSGAAVVLGRPHRDQRDRAHNERAGIGRERRPGAGDGDHHPAEGRAEHRAGGVRDPEQGVRLLE